MTLLMLQTTKVSGNQPPFFNPYQCNVTIAANGDITIEQMSDFDMPGARDVIEAVLLVKIKALIEELKNAKVAKIDWQEHKNDQATNRVIIDLIINQKSYGFLYDYPPSPKFKTLIDLVQKESKRLLRKTNRK